MARRRKRNPSIVIVGPNPGGSKPTKGATPIGKDVEISVRYEHVTEGPREHLFTETVQLEGLPDGSVRIYHERLALWEDL